MQPFAWLWELRYVDSQNERTQGAVWIMVKWAGSRKMELKRSHFPRPKVATFSLARTDS